MGKSAARYPTGRALTRRDARTGGRAYTKDKSGWGEFRIEGLAALFSTKTRRKKEEKRGKRETEQPERATVEGRRWKTVLGYRRGWLLELG